MQAIPAQPPGEAMSWEDYVRSGSEPPSEYIGGRRVMVPSPTREHQEICSLLWVLLRQVPLPGHKVTQAWGWLIGDDEFIPDVMVHPITSESVRFTGTPLLVVEVLSTSRARDLVLKPQRYAKGGAQYYWVFDPVEFILDVFALDADVYNHVITIEEHEPRTVDLAGVPVVIDLTTLRP